MTKESVATIPRQLRSLNLLELKAKIDRALIFRITACFGQNLFQKQIDTGILWNYEGEIISFTMFMDNC